MAKETLLQQAARLEWLLNTTYKRRFSPEKPLPPYTVVVSKINHKGERTLAIQSCQGSDVEARSYATYRNYQETHGPYTEKRTFLPINGEGTLLEETEEDSIIEGVIFDHDQTQLLLTETPPPNQNTETSRTISSKQAISRSSLA